MSAETALPGLHGFEAVGVPEHGRIEIKDDAATIHANGQTDWFFRPDGSGRRSSHVPKLIRRGTAPIVSLSARVQVDFASRFDAGALFVAVDEDNWAKIAYEYSAAREPTVVTVVTRSTSDDADGVTRSGEPINLRVYTDGHVIALHCSDDGKRWRFVRLFTLPGVDRRPIVIGFGAQSPTGAGVSATFSGIKVSYDKIDDLRNGS